MFDPKSRYAKAQILRLTDARGRTVEVVCPVLAPVQGWMGIHRHHQGERLDHLAARYLSDPSGYWRIAEINDVMTAEVLTERSEITIPLPGGSGS